MAKEREYIRVPEGNPIDRWLEQEGRSRLWLATRVGTTEQTICRIAGGKQWPGRKIAQALKGLGISLDELEGIATT